MTTMPGTSVPKWGPYTESALQRYPGVGGRIPASLLRAFGTQKLASARANGRLGELPGPMAERIAQAASEVANGDLVESFPLGPWQAGDGNPTHINVNEVIAIRAAELSSVELAIHPLDHVNRNQSSNDTWPTVTHIALATTLRDTFGPALACLASELEAFAARHADTPKVGRTFLRDAHGTSVGAEFGGFAALLRDCLRQVALAQEALLSVPQGGGAVGTGRGIHPDFAAAFIGELRAATGQAFVAAPLPCACQVVDTALLRASHVAVEASVICLKLSRDIELLASGPHCGLGELVLPDTGPGSSSMAGKINPTHASMLEMMCMKVQANHAVVLASLSSARLQLNTTYLLAACAVVESLETLAQGVLLFAAQLVAPLQVDHQALERQVRLSPGATFLRAREVGYDAVAAGRR
ncbi:MAG: class II fumarate hydratase [Burkholderiales bacterium]|nr:class II fumarate hydratase [Burkholderiales bacterium]